MGRETHHCEYLPERINQTIKNNMSKRPKYVVTSHTNRTEEGRTDLCWMDIDIHKLERCCKDKAIYYFEYYSSGQKYSFSINGIDLKSAFTKNGVREKNNENNSAYSFFLNYTKGEIYKNYSPKSKCIIKLDSPNNIPYQSGSLVLSELLNKGGNPASLADLVARTAIWAPSDCHQRCKSMDGKCYAKRPDVRRKNIGEHKGLDKKDPSIRLDDNTYPNQQMKEMGRKFYKLHFKEYTTCHIWEKTCYDTRYHTCFANLVLLPSALASLSDFCPEIKAILQYRSYELYGWVPDGKCIPEEPDNYPTCWNSIPEVSFGKH